MILSDPSITTIHLCILDRDPALYCKRLRASPPALLFVGRRHHIEPAAALYHDLFREA